MANHKSAAKRARQSIKRNTVNTKRKKSVKTIEKKLLQALTEKKTEVANALYKTFSSLVDRASRNRVVSKNHASRKKSRLATRIASLTK